MSILLLIIWMISEVLVGYIFKYKGLSYEQVEVSGSVISKIIILIFVKIMKTKKNWAGQSVSLEVSIGLLCIPVSSIYIVHNIFALCSELESGFAFPFVSSIIILGMNCPNCGHIFKPGCKKEDLTEMIEDALDQEEIGEFDQLENSTDRMEEIEECMIERYIHNEKNI